MIRAATPLTFLLFAAFALLLISTISAPIIKSITLAEAGDLQFGVFGYCEKDVCSSVRVGYHPESLVGNTKTEFTLPTNARRSLSNLLIVHPIAAGMSLILFILAACSHLHKPSHSPFYLLCTLLFALPTFLLALLAFLVDILLFVPNLRWGGWIVLGATVCIAIAGVITCAMRRTVVSREARKRRIADNDDMNGLAHRAEAEAAAAAATTGFSVPSREPTLPSTGISRTPSREPKLPEFATFDVGGGQGRGRSPDGERIPLTSRMPDPGRRNDFVDPNAPGGFNPAVPRLGLGGEMQPLNKQFSNGALSDLEYPQSSRYGNGGPPPMPIAMVDGRQGSPGRGRGGGPYRGGPPRGGMGSRGGPQGARGGGPGPYRGRGGPNGMVVPPSSYYPGGQRGRGGYPDNGRGGYDNSRGGYTGYDTSNNSRQHSSGRPSFENVEPYRQQTQQQPMPQFDNRLPPPNTNSNEGYVVPAPMNEDQSRFEMDSGHMQMPNEEHHIAAPGVGMAIGHAELGTHHGLMSPTSVYSDEYVPPRTAWANAVAARGTPLPLDSPTHNSPVELPAALPEPTNTSPTRGTSEYYEDIDPRFAQPTALPGALQPGNADAYRSQQVQPTHQHTYDAGYMQPPPQQQTRNLTPPSRDHSPGRSYEEMQQTGGSRSPAMSSSSHFTSISQRGVNPEWRPEPPTQPMPQQRRPAPRLEERILANNPDFEFKPGGRAMGGTGGMGR